MPSFAQIKPFGLFLITSGISIYNISIIVDRLMNELLNLERYWKIIKRISGFFFSHLHMCCVGSPIATEVWIAPQF